MQVTSGFELVKRWALVTIFLATLGQSLYAVPGNGKEQPKWLQEMIDSYEARTWLTVRHNTLRCKTIQYP